MLFVEVQQVAITVGEGFLAVYSIDSHESFENIDTLHEQILRVKGKDYFPVIIVANKWDLGPTCQVGANGATHPFFLLFLPWTWAW